MSNCTAWYQTDDTDDCDVIAAMFGTFSKADFVRWNPIVFSDCSNIKPDTYYCVAVPGTPSTRTAPLPTTTKTPTQSGIAANCVDFWLVSKSVSCFYPLLPSAKG